MNWVLDPNSGEMCPAEVSRRLSWNGLIIPATTGHWRRSNGHARITGPCGDTMEFWIQVTDKRIIRAGFTTTGCGPSRAAGSMATELAVNRPLREAGFIEQADILEALGGLPKDSEHCALLASNTLKAAIRDYLSRSMSQNRSTPKLGGLRALLLDRLLVQRAARQRVRRAVPGATGTCSTRCARSA